MSRERVDCEVKTLKQKGVREVRAAKGQFFCSETWRRTPNNQSRIHLLCLFMVQVFTKKKTHIIDPNLGLCRGLHEGTVVELPGHVEALVLADNPLVLQVALVTHLERKYFNLQKYLI